MLTKIRQAKYPAVTTEEEEASVPLQIVLQGVFDAVRPLRILSTRAKREAGWGPHAPRAPWPRPGSARTAAIGHTLEGSFSGVSKPNFVSKYAFESSRRYLQNALLCTALKL